MVNENSISAVKRNSEQQTCEYDSVVVLIELIMTQQLIGYLILLDHFRCVNFDICL